MYKPIAVAALLLLCTIPAFADDRGRVRSNERSDHSSRSDRRDRAERSDRHDRSNRSDRRDRAAPTDREPAADRIEPIAMTPAAATAPTVATATAIDPTSKAAVPNVTAATAAATPTVSPIPLATTTDGRPDKAACSTAAVSQWLSPASIAEKLSAQGFTVIRIDSGSGCYEAQVKDDKGTSADLYLDAVTAAILSRKDR